MQCKMCTSASVMQLECGSNFKLRRRWYSVALFVCRNVVILRKTQLTGGGRWFVRFIKNRHLLRLYLPGERHEHRHFSWQRGSVRRVLCTLDSSEPTKCKLNLFRAARGCRARVPTNDKRFIYSQLHSFLSLVHLVWVAAVQCMFHSLIDAHRFAFILWHKHFTTRLRRSSYLLKLLYTTQYLLFMRWAWDRRHLP